MWAACHLLVADITNLGAALLRARPPAARAVVAAALVGGGLFWPPLHSTALLLLLRVPFSPYAIGRIGSLLVLLLLLAHVRCAATGQDLAGCMRSSVEVGPLQGLTPLLALLLMHALLAQFVDGRAHTVQRKLR